MGPMELSWHLFEDMSVCLECLSLKVMLRNRSLSNFCRHSVTMERCRLLSVDIPLL